MKKEMVPFAEFVHSLQGSTMHSVAKHADTKVTQAAHFDQMREHLLSLYKGVDAKHSFMDENGQIWDCIPVDQQPSLRGKGLKAATPPPQMPGAAQPTEHAANTAKMINPQLSKRKDANGNAMECPAGYIPMRRITLEEITRFETLQKFFQKSPFDTGGHPSGHGKVELKDQMLGGVAATHKYAHASQGVNNLGSESTLNVWQPTIGANQIFSLSQLWVTAGSYPNTLQTVECGWQVYPGKYGNSHPCLFIYWTADAYHNTGNYNLDKPAFVQTNHAYTIGGTLAPVSTYGGTQYELQFAWYLYQGNWWLYLNGGAASNAIGYYPGSLFGGGPLANHSNNVDFGGEVVGTTSWPPMGSGHFPAEGFKKAAFQRLVRYFPTAGGVANASLSASQPSPACYKITLASGGGWGTYFYFGGPGGTGC